jgi:hydroxymethylpyrimidine/phosphomethylpyrimidine kinase
VSGSQPIVLSVAGLDPCGGAGLLADIRVFEALGCCGMGVCTCTTYQTHHTFSGLQWLEQGDIVKQLLPLVESYKIAAVKVGLIQDLSILNTIVNILRGSFTRIPIVWDPVLSASAGGVFHLAFSREELLSVCSGITVITPNRQEAGALIPDASMEDIINELRSRCGVVVKSYKEADGYIYDALFSKGERVDIKSPLIPGASRHGTGCVFSSSLAAGLAKGLALSDACSGAQAYTHGYLTDNTAAAGAPVQGVPLQGVPLQGAPFQGGCP